jgi:O-antigen/teichoic acid export membrane protein
LINSEIKKRFIKLFSIDLLTKGGVFLLLPLYLNLMTQEEFGNYSYMFSIVGMLSFVFGMGQHATLNRFYHSSEYSKDLVIENLHLILLTSFIFFGFILAVLKVEFISLFFKFNISDTVYYGMLFLALLIALNQIFMSFLYQSENIKMVQKKNIFDFIIINILALSFLYFLPYPKDQLRILAITIGYLIILLLYYRKLISKNNLKFSNLSKVFYKRGFKNGLPMAVGSFSNFFITFGDRFVIEKLLDASALGIFSFSMVIVGILMLMHSSFQNVWLPYLFKEKNLDISFKRVYKIIGIFFIVMPVMGISFYALIYILTNHFIEHSYIKSLDFLWVLVLASFFQIAGMIVTGFYQIFEKNYISVPINIGAGILNIWMNYYFIDMYGLMGAAISTAIISCILFITHFSIVHYYRKQGAYSEYFSKYSNK